jgi:acyl-CoA thioester hydrolase
MSGSAPEDGSASSPDDAVGERLVSSCPVIVRRRVAWGECDPAGLVYAPRFAEYLASAFGWFGRIMWRDGPVSTAESRTATPIKALSLEFHQVLRPNQLFDMVVRVGEVRQRTFDLEVAGQSLAGELCFLGKLSPIIVSVPDFGRAELPEPMRVALLAYRDRCAASAVPSSGST